MNPKMQYHLVLEFRPGDFMPIDINILLNDNNDYTKLDTIDAFTKKYTQEEIYDMILEQNIVPNRYLIGELQIINDRKYRYKVIYKDTKFSLDLFFSENISNKHLMNKFLNIYLKYDKDKDKIQNAINNENVYEVLEIMFDLPYEKLRNIYTYMVDNFS